MRKKTRLILASFPAIFLIALASIFFGNAGPQKISGVLEGFDPGAIISYRVSEAGKETALRQGEKTADQTGAVKLPVIDKYDGMALTYDLSIARKDRPDPLTMSFTLDGENNKIDLRAEGLEQFGRVVARSQDQVQEMRGDWAGLVRSSLETSAPDPENGEIFQVAFMGQNYARDVQETEDSRIIKIFQAPGGGGPMAPVNQYIASHCGIYSWCNGAMMQSQINLLKTNYVRALMSMTEQFSAVMMHQAQIIGSFMDAKFQLQTQRELQLLQAEAHKDYQPSEQMCQFGSFVKTIATTEQKGILDKAALNKILNEAYVNAANSRSAQGYYQDIEARIVHFRRTHCDPQDNNNGLGFMCDHDQNFGAGQTGAVQSDRMNKDVDYARTIGAPLTLKLGFNASSAAASPDEEDVVALARNLYWPRVMKPATQKELPDLSDAYLQSRSLATAQNVAHTSFINLAALKTQSERGLGAESGWNFMKSLMRDFNISDSDIHALLGDYPSYYAQMEVLTKKIYQNPDFYTNLYDKPANIERVGVSLEAIKLMQGRDLYESALRREMLISLMVEDELRRIEPMISARISSEVKKTR